MSFATMNAVNAARSAVEGGGVGGGLAGTIRAPQAAPAVPGQDIGAAANYYQARNVATRNGSNVAPNGQMIGSNAGDKMRSGLGLAGTYPMGGGAQHLTNTHTGGYNLTGDREMAYGPNAASIAVNTAPVQGGVIAGQTARPAQPPAAPQGPAFDPNDPNNAALAGYMNG